MSEKHTYADAMFDMGENGTAAVYYDASAVVLAIKNILLTAPGNFPETPSFGMNIAKYQFEALDAETVSEIEAELSFQINTYIPSIGSAEIKVVKLEVDEGDDCNGIGISVSVLIDGTTSTCNFIVLQENQAINIAVEVI